MTRAVAALGASTALYLLTATFPAAAAPPQLLNKTVLVSFSMSIPARADDGSSTTHPRQMNRTIYISSKGRVFSRSDRRAGRNSDTVEVGPERTGGTFRFDGNRLIGVNLGFISGAGQLTVTFDSGFQSCSASVIMGAERGKPIKFKGLNGKTYTATGPATASTPSCSIRDGNPFS